MKVAEFFAELGIKGSDQAGKALNTVDSGMKGLVDTSLEVKAAIIGAVYALEQLMSKSMKAGTAFTNFEAFTGTSAQRLQSWQYAARQAGVGAGEVEQAFKNVQRSMSSMMLGEAGGVPKGFQIIAQAMKINPNDLKNTEVILKKITDFVRTNPQGMSTGIVNKFVADLIGENMTAGARRGAFTEQNFSKAPKYSEGEIGNLDKINVAWQNLGAKIEMAFGKLNSKHGLQVIQEITLLTTELMKLGDQLLRVAEKLEIFKTVGDVFKGWEYILSAINGDLDKTLQKDQKDKKKGGFFSSLNDKIGKEMDSFFAYKDLENAEKESARVTTIAPVIRFPAGGRQGQQGATTNNVNNKIDIHVKDADAGGREMKRQVEQSVRTNPAIAGGH